jgi:hypothetical protein
MMSPAFEALPLDTLDEVSGGRTLTRTGPDPSVVQMISSLVESIKTVSQAKQQKEAASQQMISGLMQTMMQKRMG